MSRPLAVAEAAPTLPQLACSALQDAEAQDALLQRCRPIVYAIILDRVHNPDVADDLTQEALADIAHGLPRLRNPEVFRVWVRRIAINRCKMWWRRAQPEVEPLAEDYPRLVHEDTFAEAARRESWRELRRALADLPEPSRLALVMHVVGGLNQTQIAEALGISVSNVAVRIHRARARLRQSLRPLQPISEEEWHDAK